MSSFGRRIRMCTAALVAAVLLVQPPLSAQRPEVDEDGVKAAFLYNFTKFIDWPSSAFAADSSPFVVCAYADAGFRKKLEEILQGEQVRGRPITIAAGRSRTPEAATCSISRRMHWDARRGSWRRCARPRCCRWGKAGRSWSRAD